MIETLIVTLREGIEAALIIGITLTYLTKIGRPEMRRTVYSALLTAILGSVIAAFAVSRANINQDIFEGWLMLIAAAFVLTMLLFMARASRSIKGDIEARLDALAGASSRTGIFVFVLLMVLREGVETVLILSAVSFNSSDLSRVVGIVLGIVIAIAFGVTFVKGSVRINLQRFFKVTTGILVLVAIQLTVSGLHELSENGVLPSSRTEMAIIGPIVRNDIFFFITIVALAALMVLFESRRKVPAPASDVSAPERRRAISESRQQGLWMAAVFGSSFVFIALVTAQFIYVKNRSALSPATAVDFEKGSVTISTRGLGKGQLNRYTEIGGAGTRFLLYRKPNGSIATVFDACTICGSAGYVVSSNGVLCKNCAAPINPESIGTPGGCNPVPMASTIGNDTVTVTRAQLAAGQPYFKGR
jgi:high-affinity iron transporter